MPVGEKAEGLGQSLIMTPACNSEAGAATVLFAAIGSIRVATTPIPNTAIRISIRSGLRFTLGLLSLCTSRAGRFWEDFAVLLLELHNH